MKLDDDKLHHNNISRVLLCGTTKCDGCLKLDSRARWGSGTEFLTQEMVEDTNPSQDMVHMSGQVVVEDVSYDKDVVEIKLPDTVVPSNYGANFVKDVCIDEGVLPHQKISAEKIVDQKASPNFDCPMRDTNNNVREGEKADFRKSKHELNPETPLLPVGCAADDNNDKQYSSGKEYNLEGRSTAANFTGNLSDQKISLKELLSLESAKESKHTGTISSESSENHMPSLHGEAVAQISINECHEVEAVASKTSELVRSGVPCEDNANGCSAAMPEEDGPTAALDVRGSNQVNHYNPFIDLRSSLDTWEPECSVPGIADTASTEPLCHVKKADACSDIVNDASEDLNEVETAEPIVDSLSSSSSDVRSSEKSNDLSGILASEVLTGPVETAVATSSSPNNVEPSDANSENHQICENDGIANVHDFNPRETKNGMSTMDDDRVSKSSTYAQKDFAVEQTLADGAKVTVRSDDLNPFEPSFFGPSIMSAPVSTSGHIPYSGNISVRSDSSTTSTRSFAFPVLQRECSSSPVRMAKAEHRRIRRRRDWRSGLLCCKF